MTRCLAVLLLLLLAGCQVATGPGGPPPGSGSGPGFYREAREVCRDAAARAGWRVERVLDEREVRGRGGRLVGIDVALRLRRDGRVRDRVCEFDLRTGRARLRDGGHGASDDRSPMKIARRACRREVERRGWRPRRILSERPVTRRGGRIVGAEIEMRIDRRGRRDTVLCDYRYADDRARLRGTGGRGGGGLAAQMREAEHVCTRLAINRGLEVRRVLSRKRYLHGNGRLRGAEIVLRVARGNRVYPVTCTYTARSGTARF